MSGSIATCTFTTYDELSRPFESKQDIFDENQQPVATGGASGTETFVRSLTAYDRSSRVRGVIEDDGDINASTNATTALQYDGASRLAETMRGSAAQVADGEINTIYGYDLNSRLHTIEDDAGKSNLKVFPRHHQRNTLFSTQSSQVVVLQRLGFRLGFS